MMMNSGMVTAAYIIAAILFILSLAGLSKQETARQGNQAGIAGMAIAVIATIIGDGVSNYGLLLVTVGIGGAIGAYLAKRVEMTEMPELVAILHSFVGLAAVLVGFASYMTPDSYHVGTERTIHNVEIYLGILIGALTFTGSVVAFGKLSGKLSSQPLILPRRHLLNAGIGIACLILLFPFISSSTSTGIGAYDQNSTTAGIVILVIMTLLAFAFGVHMVMAIGGADMPVVISMLNSYSGWAAAATGFMLSNDLLIVVGALVGSSGAILSYIMCRAMNRKFLSVIMGGWGDSAPDAVADGAEGPQGEVVPIRTEDVASLCMDAESVVIVPGYGMAVAHAQHPVSELTNKLKDAGVNVRFAIHPVAGRMPGHMNVLLAEANVPYDLVLEMDEINDDLPTTDGNAKTVIVSKRSMATGYAGVENPLFFKENTRMLFGDAKDSVNTILAEIS